MSGDGTVIRLIGWHGYGISEGNQGKMLSDKRQH